MTKKPQQVDLEEVILDHHSGRILPKRPQPEITDAFTGVVFVPHTRNHYEVPDPKPFAPNLQISRPTVRQRVENLLSRGVDPLHDFMRQQQEPDTLDFDVPDDPEAPLTPSEQNHLDMLASELAERAPLPDDGLPRPQPASPEGQPKAGEPPGGGGPPATSAPPKGATAAPLAAVPAPPTTKVD